jgi:hypothetical protein
VCGKQGALRGAVKLAWKERGSVLCAYDREGALSFSALASLFFAAFARRQKRSRAALVVRRTFIRAQPSPFCRHFFAQQRHRRKPDTLGQRLASSRFSQGLAAHSFPQPKNGADAVVEQKSDGERALETLSLCHARNLHDGQVTSSQSL